MKEILFLLQRNLTKYCRALTLTKLLGDRAGQILFCNFLNSLPNEIKGRKDRGEALVEISASKFPLFESCTLYCSVAVHDDKIWYT